MNGIPESIVHQDFRKTSGLQNNKDKNTNTIDTIPPVYFNITGKGFREHGFWSFPMVL